MVGEQFLLFKDRLQPPTGVTAGPKLIIQQPCPIMYWGNSAPTRMSRNSSWYLQDGSYLRLKNLTFGYTLPVNLTQRIGINQLRVYFSGDNLVTLTKYPG